MLLSSDLVVHRIFLRWSARQRVFLKKRSAPRSCFEHAKQFASQASESTAAIHDATYPGYYDDAFQFQSGWALIQYYSGESCDGDFTYDYAYKNGECVPSTYGDSIRVVFSNDDCGSTVVIYFLDSQCQIAYYYFQVLVFTSRSFYLNSIA